MLITARCPACRRPVRGVCAECWAAVSEGEAGEVRFEGVGRDLVLGLKYANARTLVRPFARRMAAQVVAMGGIGEIDIVTWAPTSASRSRRRGFDQAELLAREVARMLGVPCRRLLRRVDRGGPQTGRSRLDRLGGPEFSARGVHWRSHVLVVDDVITTGATLAAAEQALRAAGARRVTTVAAAATPRRPDPVGSPR